MVFIVLNIAIFLAFNLALYDNPEALEAFFDEYAVVASDVVNDQDYLPFLTSTFMHAGILHLAGNMLFLWIFGDNVEYAFGHIGFLLVYLLSGVAADVAQIASAPGALVPSVGASGAIAGVMGSYLVLFPKANIRMFWPTFWWFGTFTLSARTILVLWFIIQAISAFNSLGSELGGVAFAAHAGGFVTGVLLAIPLRIIKGHPDSWDKYKDDLYLVDVDEEDITALRRERELRMKRQANNGFDR